MSAAIGGSLVFSGSHLLGHGAQPALDLAQSKVGGQVLFDNGDPFPEGRPSRIQGRAIVRGSDLGGLAWRSLVLGDQTSLLCTHNRVHGVMEAHLLTQEGGGLLDLSGTQVGELSDRLDSSTDGWGAGATALNLEGFRYGILQHPSGRTDHAADLIQHWRAQWFRRGGQKRASRAPRFLAGVLKAQGLNEGARLILMDAFKAEAETKTGRLQRWLGRLFDWGFGHGFSGVRALRTVLITWLIGGFAVLMMQGGDLLILNNGAAQPGPCGDAIDPWVYAGDVMIPLLDVGQEDRCVLRGSFADREGWGFEMDAFGTRYEAFTRPALTRFFWSVYAVFGWIVVSLAIATWSGVFRRNGRD